MKYKNTSDKDLAIPGIGLVKSGEIKNMPKGFHNANFIKVKPLKVNGKLTKKLKKQYE